MNDNIEKEIFRLIREIADDERQLVEAERNEIDKRADRYRGSIERKMRLLSILMK